MCLEYATILEEQSAAKADCAKHKEHLTSLLREQEDLDHLALDVKHKSEAKVKELQSQNAQVEKMKIECAQQQLTLAEETKRTLNNTKEIQATKGKLVLFLIALKIFFCLVTEAVKTSILRLGEDLLINNSQVLDIEKKVEQESSITANLEADILTHQNELASLKSSILSIQQGNAIFFPSSKSITF